MDQREFAAEQDDEADGNDHIVQDRDEATKGEGELEAEGDVEQDADEAEDKGDERVLEEGAADECGDFDLAAIDDIVVIGRGRSFGACAGAGFFLAESRDAFAELGDDGVGILGVAADGEEGAGGRVALLLRVGCCGELKGREGFFDIGGGDFHIRAELEFDECATGEVDAEGAFLAKAEGGQRKHNEHQG